MKKTLIVLILFSFEFSFGFEHFFEYQAFSDTFFLKSEDSTNLDSEYRSDVLAYRYQYHDYLKFRSSKKRLHWVVGSLSSERFYTERSIFLEEDFGKDLRIRMVYHEKEDFEYQNQRLIIDLGYSVSKSFLLGAFGDAAFDKAKDDVGVYFEWLYDEHRFRFSYEWLDFDRNKRNLSSDTWTSKSPNVLTISINNYSDDSSLYSYELGYRYSPLSTRLFPDLTTPLSVGFSERSFLYRVLFRRNFADIEFSFQSDLWERKRQSASNSMAKVKRYQSQLEFKKIKVFERNFSFGIQNVFRSDELNSKRALVDDVLIFSSLALNKLNVNWGQELGLEHTLRNTRGESNLLAENGRKYASQSRLNYLLAYEPKETILLKLAFTFDLDRFGTGQTWEGGSGQLHIRF